MFKRSLAGRLWKSTCCDNLEADNLSWISEGSYDEENENFVTHSFPLNDMFFPLKMGKGERWKWGTWCESSAFPG